MQRADLGGCGVAAREWSEIAWIGPFPNHPVSGWGRGGVRGAKRILVHA